MLARAFFSLSRYAQVSIHHSLGLDDINQSDRKRTESERSISPASATDHTGSPGTLNQPLGSLKNIDVMLPKVCEALVLVTQCMVTIAIEAEEEDAEILKNNMMNYFIEAQTSGLGIVENLIGEYHLCVLKMAMSDASLVTLLSGPSADFLVFAELLRLLDLFLPRINFGKPVSLTGQPIGTSMPGRDQEQVPDSSVTDNHGFAYLKRDLVRLLGILCHEKKTVQDRVREARGIEVVLNMCVIDERNPCKSVISEF